MSVQVRERTKTSTHMWKLPAARCTRLKGGGGGFCCLSSQSLTESGQRSFGNGGGYWAVVGARGKAVHMASSHSKTDSGSDDGATVQGVMELLQVTLFSPLTQQPNKVTCFNQIGLASFFFLNFF